MTGKAIERPPLSIPAARLLHYVRHIGYRAQDAACGMAGPQPATPRLSGSGKRLDIAFLVCDAGKWNAQPLFDRLVREPAFRCSFVLTLSDLSLRLSTTMRTRRYMEYRAFFAARGEVGLELYQDGRLRDPGSLAAGLVFLQQPWGMRDVPRRIGTRIPCAYASYELGVIDDPKQQFALPDFHPWLWRLFVPGAIHAEMAAGHSAGTPRERIVATGAPHLEAYIPPAPARESVPVWPRAKEAHRKRIIFAPHHSLSRGSLRLATFDWSAPALLDLARNRPELDFLLRPHPNLWYSLASNGRQQAAEEFMHGWNALPNTGILPDGEHVRAFRSSDALITDSASFLAEYMMTGRPLLRLTRPDARPLSAFGRMLEPGFYTCLSPEALRASFEAVIIAGKDPLEATRRALAARLREQSATAAADRIHDEILAALG